MDRWTRFFFQPVLPLGVEGKRATACKGHTELSRRAAAEGMVLLKNENRELPLALGSRVALFGKASVDYVKGGGGSGDVTVAYVKSLLDGMEEKEKEGKISLFHPLNDFYRDNVKMQYECGTIPGQTVEPEVPTQLISMAKAFTDTAIISICRFSGEETDRADIDFYLTKPEQTMIRQVKENFAHVIVVLNVGGMIDTSWFKDEAGILAVLLAWQGGMEGGLAAADILCGDRTPCGKLVDTFASCLSDYPSTASFHESDNYVTYREDIYVGYRYFMTIPGAVEKVNYCFGYGLSYTTFELQTVKIWMKTYEQGKEEICFQVCVTNTGRYKGKEILQIYAEAPQGKLGKPVRELKAFAKTRELVPGESQILSLTIKKDSLASYDDLGKIAKSAWVLEEGDYHFYVGNSVQDANQNEYVLHIEKNEIVEQLSEKCKPLMVAERMKADGSMEILGEVAAEEVPLNYDKELVKAYIPAQKEILPILMPWEEGAKVNDRPLLSDVAEGKITIDEFLESMTDKELVEMLGGQPNTGVANTWGIGNVPDLGIPNVMTADGPAGLRIDPKCKVYTTAWPCATLLACTFDEDLVEEVGRAGALEVKENNIGMWLTPAMNIHRNPLCGRNFEYYSEDPLVAGKIGAAMVRGIQSRRIAASVKHFACNNKETNRKNSDSRLSERALREIYLKGFEIVVKEADPWTIMTSYNAINGVRAAENKELLTDILREEWEFKGMVTSDWWNYSRHEQEVLAGNDLKMPIGKPKRLLEMLENGILRREDVLICAKRILEMILKLD